MRRLSWLFFAVALMLQALFMQWVLMRPVHAAPTIFRSSDQSLVTREVFIKDLRSADVVILGELHDNPHHHQIRGELIQTLARPSLRVLAEHLTRSQSVSFGPDLLTSLQAAGFSDKAWAWPIHEPLFKAIQSSGLGLWGANLSAEESNQAFKTRGESLPPVLRKMLTQAPFSDQQRQALEQELMESHCGALPQSMLPGMLWAQRGRDAAMAFAAAESLPSVLLAGNGHAWRHVGVPQILSASHPQIRVVSVLFVENEGTPAQMQGRLRQEKAALRSDYVWSTAAVDRPDPCLAFKKK